ncbi:unnamed protein product [Phytophthora lilii]|uniref:Unnamed protein product n=1 Tax=Phytophthora lilii TaxID=2077276 RepID=A0A9W6U8A6_9STRA|nr:unnamed protein product [Phytophthora lilii]
MKTKKGRHTPTRQPQAKSRSRPPDPSSSKSLRIWTYRQQSEDFNAAPTHSLVSRRRSRPSHTRTSLESPREQDPSHTDGPIERLVPCTPSVATPPDPRRSDPGKSDTLSLFHVAPLRRLREEENYLRLRGATTNGSSAQTNDGAGGTGTNAETPPVEAPSSSEGTLEVPAVESIADCRAPAHYQRDTLGTRESFTLGSGLQQQWGVRGGRRRLGEYCRASSTNASGDRVPFTRRPTPLSTSLSASPRQPSEKALGPVHPRPHGRKAKSGVKAWKPRDNNHPLDLAPGWRPANSQLAAN